MPIDRRHPEVARSGNFDLLLLLLLAGHLDDVVVEVSGTGTVVEAGDEIGQVVVGCADERVGGEKAEAVVLLIAGDFGDLIERAGEPLLPRLGVSKPEVAIRLPVRGVEDRVLDDDGGGHLTGDFRRLHPFKRSEAKYPPFDFVVPAPALGIICW